MTLILAFLFQLFSLLPLAAESPAVPASEMTVIPRDVFIGDEMEIRYVFHDERELLPSGTDMLVLDVPDTDDVTVLAMELAREGDSYVLTARCIAWRTGLVNLPEIVLDDGNAENEAVSEDSPDADTASDVEPESETEADAESEQEAAEVQAVTVKIPPVKIQSVVEYTEKTDLQPARAPLVIPGTTWIIYAIIILCVVLFIALIIILLRFKTVKRHFFSLFSSVLISRNFRLLRRKVRRFLKRNLKSDTDVFATELAHFIRGYMTARFKADFNAVTASEFVQAFASAMDCSGCPEAFGATEVISDILRRCDYVRFSGDTGEAGTFSGDERNSLCSDFLTAVECYDREALK